jgi:hypothetical protein
MASAYSDKKKEQSSVNKDDLGGLMAELAGRQKPGDTQRRKLTATTAPRSSVCSTTTNCAKSPS